jgi:hypothetical protein
MATTITNKHYIGGNEGDGIAIGYDTTAYIGLYGVTPVAQASAITAVATAGATADIAGIETAVNSIITALKNIGVTAAA